MDNTDETSHERKVVSKTKSCAQPMKLRSEPSKRKSDTGNVAAMSLDLVLGRLKKSKLVNGEDSNAVVRGGNLDNVVSNTEDMFMDISHGMDTEASNTNSNSPGVENASLMSMNFSHYELLRNLSHSNNSDGGFSGTNGNGLVTPTDVTVKGEHMEKYFRSAEKWNKSNSCHAKTKSMCFDVSEQ